MFCFSYRSSGDDLLPCSFSAIYSHACADVLLIPKLHLQLAAYRSIWIVCLGLHYKGIVWGSTRHRRQGHWPIADRGVVLFWKVSYISVISFTVGILSFLWWIMLKTFFQKKKIVSSLCETATTHNRILTSFSAQKLITKKIIFIMIEKNKSRLSDTHKEYIKKIKTSNISTCRYFTRH